MAIVEAALFPAPLPCERCTQNRSIVGVVAPALHSPSVRVCAPQVLASLSPPSLSALGTLTGSVLLLMYSVSCVAASTLYATSVTTGAFHSCAVSVTGDAYCWGNNGEGQLGTGSYWPSYFITPSMSNAKAVSAGYAFTCALNVTGGVYCWGDNTAGRLGTNSTLSALAPQAVHLTATLITTGDEHTCAVSDSGGLFCWGDNSAGELGLNNSALVSLPEPPSTPIMTGVKYASAGWSVTCAVTGSDDSLYCWGLASFIGKITIPSLFQYSPPSTPILTGVASVHVGSFFGCALTTNSSLYCWGDNKHGQCGVGMYGDYVPTPTFVISGVADFATGIHHMCAVMLANSGLRCWGRNDASQLGQGTGENVYSPPSADLPGIASVLSVGCGWNHTCVVVGSGEVKCWGSNSNGQLGVNTSLYSFLTSPPSTSVQASDPSTTPSMSSSTATTLIVAVTVPVAVIVCAAGVLLVRRARHRHKPIERVQTQVRANAAHCTAPAPVAANAAAEAAAAAAAKAAIAAADAASMTAPSAPPAPIPHGDVVLPFEVPPSAPGPMDGNASAPMLLVYKMPPPPAYMDAPVTNLYYAT